jgi:phosphate transport system substrate-binding protein
VLKYASSGLLRGILLLTAIATGTCAAQQTIRIWGHGSKKGDFAGDLVRRWNEAFCRAHPQVRFEVALRGDSAAIGGVYTGAADIALMGREILPIEREGFEQATGSKPLEISVMTGSVDQPHHSTALAIFVHRDNPLSGLTLAQLDAIFGADHRRGPKNIRKWDELGPAGEWAGHDIHPYGFAIRHDYGQYFEQAVMGGSQKWNSALHELDAGQGRPLLDALAKDRNGIAIASLAWHNPNCKAIAIDGVAPTRDTVMSRRYPLARPVSMVVRRSPAASLVREYIGFILSREGQQIVAQDSAYLPLPESVASEERKKIEPSVTAADGPDYLRDLEPYHPRAAVSGTIRNWGNNYIPALMQDWENGFRQFHPQVRFETNLKGTEAAVAGLYGGIADVAFVGREVYAAESRGFENWSGYRPTVIQISSGSYNTPHRTFALMVFVHKDNPLAKMTIGQLDAVFGCELRRGAPQPIRKWGQLGLSGEWTNKSIHVYGYNFDTGMARFFRVTVLQDSFKWNPELRDFDNGRDAAGEVINAGVYVLDALAKDLYGIAFANVLYANPKVKTVALADPIGGPYIEPTRENVWRRAYPITRYTNVVLNREPGKPVEPKLKEFVRYLLSREGMAAVVRDGSYLPLTRELIAEQLRKLE